MSQAEFVPFGFDGCFCRGKGLQTVAIFSVEHPALRD